MMQVMYPDECLRRLAEAGILYPPEPSARRIRQEFDALAREGADRGSLFMALAHLLGCWVPLLRHAGELAAPDSGLLALAVTEDQSGADLYAIRATAEPAPGGWRLNGKKIFVTNAPVATRFLVLTRAGSDPRDRLLSCFLLGKDTPGLRVRPMPPLMGMGTVVIGEVFLDDLTAPTSSLVGKAGQGALVFRTAMSWERSLILSPAPGTLERLLEGVVQEAGRKHRMGRPLAEQEPFREKVAEVHAAIAALREAGERAAEELDSGRNAVRSAMVAKVTSSRLYESASRILLQLGGARAYLSGSELEANFRDSLASSLYSGPNDVLDQVLKLTE